MDAAERDGRLLLAMLRTLPTIGRWTTDRRAQWLNAFAVNVDLVIEVDDTPELLDADTPATE